MKNKIFITAISIACIAGLSCQHINKNASPTNDDTQQPSVTQEQPAEEGDNSDRFEIPVYQSSRGGQIIRHEAYTLSYDADYKTPQWVGWVLTRDRANGQIPRKDNFRADPAILGAKAYPTDYKGSGYDKGHMAPCGDMKWSKTVMDESFYMSNICPQNQNLNRGDWNDLEEQTRNWARKYGTVSITAGPIYASKTPLRIGANKVAVPDGFFKVVLVGYPNHTKAYGFIFANQAGNHPLSYYQLTVDEVEEATGMDFFSALPDEIENEIETQKPSIR